MDKVAAGTQLTPNVMSRSSRLVQVNFPRSLEVLVACIWLLFLISPIMNLIQSSDAFDLKLILLGGVVVFVSFYLTLSLIETFSGANPDSDRLRKDGVLLALMTVIAIGMSIGGGPSWIGLMIFTTASAGSKFPGRIAVWLIAANAIMTLIIGWLLSVSPLDQLQLEIPILATGLLTMGAVRLKMTIRELQQARKKIERLAVADERLRFARDLHDLLGHSLSLITVKSELAKRLLHSDASQVEAELVDIERISREALQGVRDAVAGYRQLSLSSQLESGRESLSAAGIRCHIDQKPQKIPPLAEAVLAWTIREGITNVIRHSHAQNCWISITFDRRSLHGTIRNDGPASAEQDQADSVQFRFGSGLTGLAERVQQLQGNLAAHSLPDGGFCLEVTLPIPTHTLDTRE